MRITLTLEKRPAPHPCFGLIIQSNRYVEKVCPLTLTFPALTCNGHALFASSADVHQ